MIVMTAPCGGPTSWRNNLSSELYSTTVLSLSDHRVAAKGLVAADVRWRCSPSFEPSVLLVSQPPRSYINGALASHPYWSPFRTP
ncbi:hypothetical protein V6N13_052208 [Hibiscus sabdariffa]